MQWGPCKNEDWSAANNQRSTQNDEDDEWVEN